jgi:hypothetical protein
MRLFVEQISKPGSIREEARRSRKSEPGKESNYVFRYKPETEDWALTIQFTKAEVTTDDLREALLVTVEGLDS